MKAAKAVKPASSRVPQNGGGDSAVSGKRGFRRRIQFGQAAAGIGGGGGKGGGGRGGGGGGGAGAEMMARAVALDNAQGALESFYASFPVVPLLSVAHAKVKNFPIILCAWFALCRPLLLVAEVYGQNHLACLSFILYCSLSTPSCVFISLFLFCVCFWRRRIDLGAMVILGCPMALVSFEHTLGIPFLWP